MLQQIKKLLNKQELQYIEEMPEGSRDSRSSRHVWYPLEGSRRYQRFPVQSWKLIRFCWPFRRASTDALSMFYQHYLGMTEMFAFKYCIKICPFKCYSYIILETAFHETMVSLATNLLSFVVSITYNLVITELFFTRVGVFPNCLLNGESRLSRT